MNEENKELTVADSVQQRINAYRQYVSPTGDIEKQIHEKTNPGYFAKPDEYGFTEYVRDAWTDWNIMRNEVNYSTELGKYQLDEAEINKLEDAEDYLTISLLNTNSELQIEIPEELKASYEDVASQYSLQGDVNSLLNKISSAKKELFQNQNESLDAAKEYANNAQYWKDRHDISDFYQKKKEEGIFNQYELDSYLYKLPGIFGSSSASLGLQAVGAVASIAAGAALTAMTYGAGSPVGMSMIAAGFGTLSLAANVASGKRENQAEVFDNLKTRVTQNAIADGSYQDVIKLAREQLSDNTSTDDQIMDKILTNQVEINNTTFNKNLDKALENAENLYIRDNMLTWGTESVLTALNIIPIGMLSKLGKLGKLGKAVNKLNAKKAKFIDAINDRIDKVKYFGIDQSIKGMAGRTKRKFAVDLLGRSVMNASSEMIEESGQYQNAQDYIAGKYDGQQPNYIRAIAGNIANGARSLYSFYAPWDTAMTADSEWLENARSGFVLGLLNIPAMARIGFDARSAYKQVQADKFVEDVSANDIFSDKDRLHKNIFYADQASKGRQSAILSSFDKAKEIGMEGVDDQMWDEEKSNFNRMYNLVNNKKINKLAEERGYKKGTTEYNQYVGMLDYYQDRWEEAKKNYDEQYAKVNKILNDKDALSSAFNQSFFIPEVATDPDIWQHNHIEIAKTNAKRQAYEEMMEELEALDHDATELYNKFGIKYNKSDLTTARAVLKDMYDKFVDSKLTNENGEEVELSDDLKEITLPTVQRDLIDAFKNLAWSEIDLVRSQSDFSDLANYVKDDPQAVKRTQRKINKYNRVQKENERFEQTIEDVHRNQEDVVEEEDDSVITNGPGEVQPEIQPEVQPEPEVTPEVQPEPQITPDTNVESTPQENKPPVAEPETKEEKEEQDKKEEQPQPVEPEEDEDPQVILDFIEEGQAKIDARMKSKYELQAKRNELQKARKEVVTIGTEPVSKAKAQKNRDAALRVNKDAIKDLDYYSQGITHEYNEDNKYGKAHIEAQKALQHAADQIDSDIKLIMTTLDPSTAWKYRNQRNPFFVQQDIDAIQDSLDANPDAIQQAAENAQATELLTEEQVRQAAQETANRIRTVQSMVSNPLINVFDAYSRLSDLQGQLAEAISDIDTNRAEALVDGIHSAINSLNSVLDAYTSRDQQKVEERKELDRLPSYSESGHRLYNQGSEDYINYSTEPDFITQSTVEFETIDNQVFVIFNYKGKKIRTRLSPDSSALGIIQKIQEYQQQVAKNPNLQIVPIGVARTNGRITTGHVERKLTEVSDYFEAKDVYDITPENTVVGIGTGDKIRRGTSVIYNGKSSMGAPYWIIKVKRPETPQGYKQVPVKLNPVKLSELEGLADTVLDIISQLNQPKFTTKDGVQTPFTPKQLLDFIIRFGADTYIDEKAAARYTPEQLVEMRKKQLYVSDRQSLIIGSTEYDLTQLQSNKEYRQKAIEQLNLDFNFRIQDINLYSNWGGQDMAKDNPFKGLRSWFELYKKDKLTIVPGVIEFDRKMVGLEGNRKGISVLGYYIDKGLLRTDFVGMKDANLYMKDVELVHKFDEKAEDSVVEELSKEQPDSSTDQELEDFWNNEFAPFTTRDEGTARPAEEVREAARKIVTRLTDLTDVEVESGVLDTIVDAAMTSMYVLGKSKVDSIVLSNHATDDIAYHESWHRISNLLMEDEQREKLFARVRKNSKKELSDKDVDEILAERFREFQLELDNITGDYAITKFFKKVLAYIKLMRKFGSIQLAKLYFSINKGKYRKARPTQERIDRFKRIYGDQGALYTSRGVEFKTIPNEAVLDGAINSLMYVLFNMPNRDGSFTTISDYTDVDKLSLDGLKAWLAGRNNPVLLELFQNFDTVEKRLKQKLKNIQVRLINIEEQDAVEENADEDLGKIDLDGHTKESYTIDPLKNAPAEVKFFFTTVPVFKFDNSARGASLVLDQYTGCPKFVNSRFAWNVVSNDLHSAKTIQELQDLVNRYAKHNELYLGIKTKLDKLIKRSQVKDTDDAVAAEATLTKLLTTLHQNKNSFLTVKADSFSLNGIERHELNVIDNTTEVKSRSLPAQYSQNLFAKNGIFEIEDRKLKFTKDGKHKLNKAINAYNNILTAFNRDNGVLVVGNNKYDLREPANQQCLKEYFVTSLNLIGITVDVGTINEVLQRPEYGADSEFSKLRRFFNDVAYYGGFPSLFKQIKELRDIQEGQETIRIANEQEVPIIEFYNRNGFVKELAKAFIQYHSNYDNMMSYGAGNNMLYGMSQNNFTTDRVDELNTDSELVETLMSLPYQSSSLILDQVSQGVKIKAETFVNFRTDNAGDTGNDYHGINDLEDYVSKMTLILNGKLLFPTIADKKTYHVISGLSLPSERTTSGDRSNPDGTTTRRFRFGTQTINQFLKYAYSELDAVEHCINQLDPNHPDFLPEDQRIKNYHTDNKYEKDKKKYKVEPNGTRFRFLTGVYIQDDGKEVFIDFNDPKKSSKDNLKTAKYYFFNQSPLVQEALLNGILSRRVNEEIAYAQKIGLIRGEVVNGEVKTDTIQNKLLDSREIDRRAEHYRKLGYKNPTSAAIMDIIAEFTTNTIISVNEVEKVFSGDPAFYKWVYTENGVLDISVDKIKRLGALTSTGLNNRLDFEDFNPEYVCAELKDFEIGSRQFKDTLLPLFVDSTIREVVKQMHGIEATLNEDGSNKTIEELKQQYPDAAQIAEVRGRKEVAGYGDGINVADAAVYVSPEFYARMMRAIGYWSPEIKEAYRILTEPTNEAERNWESQALAYEKIMKASLKPLKYMAFGNRIENGLYVPYFNKMALFPLFESVATGDIRKLYDRMTDSDNKIDMVLFESAVKAGSKHPLSWKGEDGNVNDLYKLTTYKQNMKYLRQQLATDPHTHEEQMAGTQMLKVALANLDLLGNYGFGDDKVKGEVIRDTIFAAMNELSNRGRQRLEKMLFDENGNVDPKKLSEALIRDLETQDADNNILDGVAYDEEKKQMHRCLSAVSNNSWVESRFISQINKETIDVNLPGGAFIQRSAFGMAADQVDVISDKMLNNGMALKTIDEKDGSLQAVVSINLLKHIIPGYENMTFTEAKQWLLDRNVIGENSEPSAIGYRIPTQAQASIQATKFMDVLPEIMGDTIVLPEDFTKQTGSDYDIDKLYISRYSYDKNGKKIQFDDEKGMDGNSEAAIKNKLIEQYIRVLTTTEYTNQLKVSIDNATTTVKDVLKIIESSKPKHFPKPFEVYSPQYQEARKAEYTVGKAGIGPFALNNAHHILTQLMRIKFLENNFTNTLGLVDAGLQYDQDGSGRRILDWLSAMINAFVDIAKDPYIVRLNVNPYTYNMTSYLLRMGKGEQTFYFLNQPVIKDIADAVMKVRGKYGSRTDKPQYQIENEVVDEVLKKYGTSTSEIREKYLKDKDAKNHLTNLMADFFNGKLEHMLLDKGVTEQQRKEFQELVWAGWLMMEPYSQSLANLVKYSKIDTKKMGKSFAEQRVFENGMKAMEKPTGSLFAVGEVTRFYNGTFLRTKANNSIGFGRQLFQGQLLRTTPSFIESLDKILYRLGKSTGIDNNLLRTVINSMEASIKSEFFNQKMQEKGINSFGLLYGKNSVPNRLMQLRNRVYNNELPDLKSAEGGFTNELLNYLIPNNLKRESTFAEPDYINVRSSFGQDVIEKNMIITAWEELLHHKNAEVRDLAEDLVYYAFITSGDNKNLNSFFEFVPDSWREDYSNFLQDKIERDQVNVDYRDIYLNNWSNNEIVPTVSVKDYRVRQVGGEWTTEEVNVLGIKSKETLPNTKEAPYLIFEGDKVGSLAINPVKNVIVDVINDRGMLVTRTYPVFPSFVKVKYGTQNTPNSYVVYELVGYNEEFDKRKTIYRPVYLAVNKKGYRHRGNVIVEYGRSDNFAFNHKQMPLTSKDLIPGVLGAMIDKKTYWNKSTRDMFKRLFTWFHRLSELPSYQSIIEGADVFEEVREEEVYYTGYGFEIIPIKSVDTKATNKASISNKYIGFADGIEGSSTAEYARQASEQGVPVNFGEYSPDDVVFVSIPGLRGNEQIRHEQQDKTIQEALEALASGAKLITDNADYVSNSSYNEGEKKLREALLNAGAIYEEMLVDGELLGSYSLPLANTSVDEQRPGENDLVKQYLEPNQTNEQRPSEKC